MTVVTLEKNSSFDLKPLAPVLLAPEITPNGAKHVLCAVNGVLRSISVQGGLRFEVRFPFKICLLSTAVDTVIVAGEKEMRVLGASGKIKATHQFAVRALCAGHGDRFAFCVENHPDEIYTHHVSAKGVEQVLTLTHPVSQIGLKESLVAAAHPDTNMIAIWNIDTSTPVYEILLGSFIEKLSFGLNPEDFCVWTTDGVFERYNREHCVERVAAECCSFGPDAILYAKKNGRSTLQWSNGACELPNIPSGFHNAVATHIEAGTSKWIANLEGRDLVFYRVSSGDSVVDNMGMGDCTLS